MNKIKGLERVKISLLHQRNTKRLNDMENHLVGLIAERIGKITAYVKKNFAPKGLDFFLAQTWLLEDVTRFEGDLMAGEPVAGQVEQMLVVILAGHPRIYPPFLKAMAHQINGLEALSKDVGRYLTDPAGFDRAIKAITNHQRAQ